MIDIRKQLSSKLQTAVVLAFGREVTKINPQLMKTNNPQHGDYQSNIAFSLAKRLQKSPLAIAKELGQHFPSDEICEPPEVAGQGFINFRLKKTYIESQIESIESDSRLGVAFSPQLQTVLVDFSSPNIAKEMHVGHLRSTIIGDCLARVLEFRGHQVLRINHVGDWGTQFGMLITHLQERYPEVLISEDKIALGDLVEFYRQAKQRFDEDDSFTEKARQAVIKLQAEDAQTRTAWQLLCQRSREEFQSIYDLLNIRLTERGESFYNPFLPDVISKLDQQGLLEESQGAKCVFLEGFENREGKPQPLIVQKSDGGYNYETTDLAAIRYRVEQDNAQRIIYVVDVGQSDHFEQVFQVAKKAGWLPETVEAIHIPFGLVQGQDGKKFKTRSGETVKLKDLLNEAVVRARHSLTTKLEQQENPKSQEFIEQVSRVIGISAVKYADLSQNRLSNYIFSYDKMLALQGNTAPYLLYAYVRIQGINRKNKTEFSDSKTNIPINLEEETELNLAKHMLRLGDVVAEVEQELLPNRLCQYLFELSQKFNLFYDRCPVLDAPDSVKMSRLILCDLTARTLKLGLSLLGIDVLERM